MMKLTGIKKAVGDYQRWLDGDLRRNATIMIDVSTGEIWCDTFIDINSWKEYHDDSIHDLKYFMLEHGVNRINMKNIKEYALRMIETNTK